VPLISTQTDRLAWSRTCVCATVIASLLSAMALAANPPVAADVRVDNQLIATVRQKADSVLRLKTASTNTLDLNEYLAVQSARTEALNRTAAAAPSRLSETEPVFALRGLSSSNNRPLALLNSRWYGVGELVTSNGLRIAQIGNNHVVLVDAQGIRQVVTLYHDHQ